MDLPFRGQRIAGTTLTERYLQIDFDGGHLVISDAGEMCCRDRYITCEGDPASIVGSRLLTIEAKAGPDRERREQLVREVSFVDVITDGGSIRLCTLNDICARCEHDEYLKGSDLVLDVREGADYAHRWMRLKDVASVA